MLLNKCVNHNTSTTPLMQSRFHIPEDTTVISVTELYSISIAM